MSNGDKKQTPHPKASKLNKGHRRFIEEIRYQEIYFSLHLMKSEHVFLKKAKEELIGNT